MTRPILLTVTYLAVCTVVSPLQVNKVSVEDEVVKEIKQLEGERSRNLVNGDAEKQDQLLAPEFVEVSATGQVRTKAENIQGMKSGQTHWEAFDLSDLDVRVYGETAVVTGRLRRKGTSAGRDISGQSRYTRYYVRRQGHWQAIFQHGIPIRDADNPSAPGQTRTTTTDSDSGPDAQAVLARTEELNQAFLHADIATLERIIADDCLQITQNGSRTKTEWLAPYRTGASRFESINPPEWRRVRLYGDVAVVTSAADAVVVVQGKRGAPRFFNTRTWVKRSGQWYLVLAQNTPRATAESTVSAEQEILRLEEERRQAILHNDAAAMDRLSGEEFIVTDVQGRVHDKADEVALYRDTRRRTESWEPSDVKVSVYGDTAVVTERAAVKDALEGERRDIQLRLTHVWVKRDGRWQVVARHATRISEQTVYALPTEGGAPVKPQTGPNPGTDKPGADSRLEQQIVSLDEEFEEYRRRDQAGDKMLADDYIGVPVSGRTLDKAGTIELFRSGRVQTKSLEMSGRNVRLYGDTAIVIVTRHLNDAIAGIPRQEQHRCTKVWVKRNGQWQVVSFQATKITGP